jgi:hypothetical protein
MFPTHKTPNFLDRPRLQLFTKGSATTLRQLGSARTGRDKTSPTRTRVSSFCKSVQIFLEALYFAIGQPTVAPFRAQGAKNAPEIHTHCGRLIPSAPFRVRTARTLLPIERRCGFLIPFA